MNPNLENKVGSHMVNGEVLRDAAVPITASIHQEFGQDAEVDQSDCLSKKAVIKEFNQEAEVRHSHSSTKTALKQESGQDNEEDVSNQLQKTVSVKQESSQNAEVDLSNPFWKLTKRKMKRMKMTAEKFIQIRKEKRMLEKQRKKAKRAAIREAGGELPKRAKKKFMGESKCKQRVAIDMSFSDKMTVRDIHRTIAQLSFCYGANRRVDDPLQLTIAHLDGLQQEVFFSNETRHNWDVNIAEETLTELFKTEDIVYLTADSENVIESLDSSKVYVIGGLLDHNAHKGLCLNVAKENNFAHGRLPIDNFVKLNSRKVLTINQVFEILLQYLETNSWEDAFYKVIPKRKLDCDRNKTEDIRDGSEAKREVCDKVLDDVNVKNALVELENKKARK